MENRQTFKLVNLGLAGEPVTHGLQQPDTLEVITYDRIKWVSNSLGEVRDAIIPDDPDSVIPKHPEHLIELTLDENGFATIYLD
jgi:hypothetical protein